MASIVYLPFLRPLPLPLPRLQQLPRRMSSARCLRQESITATKTPATLKPLPNPSQPLSYHVHRTASQQLPVYHLAKRGGNLHQTRVRKIDGNIAELRNDLQRALGLKEEHITINQLTKHIIIKGWRKPEVSNYLEQMQF